MTAKSAFPTETGDHDDDLTPEQLSKLEIQTAYKTSTPMPMSPWGCQAKTWACPEHDYVVLQGYPCPECGVKQLLD